VTIRYSKGSLSLNTDGVVREDGFTGEKIRVMNFNSKKIITAVVVDSTTVAIGEGL
jgi:flagella basal body P-ring formation protein FlgA